MSWSSLIKRAIFQIFQLPFKLKLAKLLMALGIAIFTDFFGWRRGQIQTQHLLIDYYDYVANMP
jgi:hypothetical protein